MEVPKIAPSLKTFVLSEQEITQPPLTHSVLPPETAADLKMSHEESDMMKGKTVEAVNAQVIADRGEHLVCGGPTAFPFFILVVFILS